MQSTGSSSSIPTRSHSGSTSRHETEDDGNQSNETQPMELLELGYPVVIRIDMKTLLEHVMNSLGSHREPVFTEIDCGDNGLKFSVSLNVSGLESVSGNRISKTVVVGEPAVDRNTAESNAAWKALNHVHHNHFLNLIDFSSRVAQNIHSHNTYDLVISGVRSLEKIYGVWDITFAKSHGFAIELERKQSNCNLQGDPTHNGVVFGVPAGSLTNAFNDLHKKTSNIRQLMNQLEDQLRVHQKESAEKVKVSERQARSHNVKISSKEILHYLLTFLGLDDAKYRTSPGVDGQVRSFLKLEFPEYDDYYKFSGRITIEGHGSTSVEANENAAFEALLFIEEQFPVQLVDWNYELRKKAIKEQNGLLVMITSIVEVGNKLKRMWLDMKNEIQGQLDLFKLDPTQLFVTAQAQIDAYTFCSQGLQNITQHAANGYQTCASDFKVLANLSWQHMVLRTKLKM